MTTNTAARGDILMDFSSKFHPSFRTLRVASPLHRATSLLAIFWSRRVLLSGASPARTLLARTFLLLGLAVIGFVVAAWFILTGTMTLRGFRPARGSTTRSMWRSA